MADALRFSTLASKVNMLWAFSSTQRPSTGSLNKTEDAEKMGAISFFFLAVGETPPFRRSLESDCPSVFVRPT
jgi:hypothetical protein